MEFIFKKIREEKELKQKEIALLTGISRGAYANIEAEIANVKLEYLIKYCYIFKVSLDYVCNLTPNNNFSIKYNKKIDKQILNERLCFIEKEQNLKSKDVAKFLGILESTYSQYKSVKTTNLIQTLMLKAIAKKYNYSMDWIVGMSDKKHI